MRAEVTRWRSASRRSAGNPSTSGRVAQAARMSGRTSAGPRIPCRRAAAPRRSTTSREGPSPSGWATDSRKVERSRSRSSAVGCGDSESSVEDKAVMSGSERSTGLKPCPLQRVRPGRRSRQRSRSPRQHRMTDVQILVIAEHAMIGALLGALVELAGHRPRFAEAGEAPDAAIERLRPDLVLLDCEHVAAGDEAAYRAAFEA